ncbi:MAG TPA: 3'-5' exonuclease [Saprospiraceae bacterium]|nr:3'-5' exonuclease [Saprospiraceae bacterium]
MSELTAKVDYLADLNQAQRDAVTCTDGPIMVIAGPGSGKTRVLTYRISYLIEQGVPPWQILALTFTNKAAKEMRERIEKVVGSRAKYIWAGTYHSIFAKILRIEAAKIGYPPNFTIYDTDDTKSLIGDIISELSLDKQVYNAGQIRARISSAKSNLISPKAYLQQEELMNQDKLNRIPYFQTIYERYVNRCQKAGAMDFDDLLYQMYIMLYRNPENVKEKYQSQFRYILVDEFQDTNYLQYAIVKQLIEYPGSNKNICIVGDDAQSIYAFRGATIRNIFDFESDYPQHRKFKLEQNYRSTEHIVSAANQVIQNNRNQIEKTLWTDESGGNKIRIIKAVSDQEEGKRVADSIVEWKNRAGLANHQFAILYRTNAQSRIVEEQLRRNNIPYKVFGGLSFYQRKEIKDFIAYLRLATNPRDEEALKRVINYPRRGIGESTIQKALEYANEHQITLWEALHRPELLGRSASAVKHFLAVIQSCMEQASTQNAYAAALYIGKASGLLDALKADRTQDGISRLDNVNALLDGIQEYLENDEAVENETGERDLSAYLQTISLLTDQDEEIKNHDFVTLMSVHAAKGLEFHTVFIVGMEENLFPSYMSMADPDQLEEERRLFYVAITRAKRQLILTYATMRYQYGKPRFNDPSRFLEEIDQRHIDTAVTLRNAGPFADGPRILSTIPKLGAKKENKVEVDPAQFKVSPSEEIEVGMEVLHIKFGPGKVLHIDGARDNRVATIEFHNIDDPQRRIMLKFSKLQIIKR